MTIQLLDGIFPANDAKALLTNLFAVKIKYHEDQIGPDSNEEQIKMRENKIKDLQNELKKMLTYLKDKQQPVKLSSGIDLN
ncbi:MAG: hypothetical protein MUE71_11755 [Chitinophagaceae bacterium]|jgi:hypothetical protein|nr:hypothetical protein [Chitinophagaceae bacterium]MCU0404854.1 hypothetical protein [Chitinophagaceae bacterium]